MRENNRTTSPMEPPAKRSRIAATSFDATRCTLSRRYQPMPPAPKSASPANPAAQVGILHAQAESAVRDRRRNVEINIGKACNNRHDDFQSK